MEDIMKMMKGKMQPVQGKEKENKMQVLKDLIQQMNMLMADEGQMEPMEGAKIEVEAQNPEGLEKGLEMAQEVVGETASDEMPMMDDEDEEDYV